MTENLFVTVIMPIYNQANFVLCAIKSLLRQTFTAWELVIVDDGSTDGLHDTLKDYISNDGRIRYFRNDSNRGLGFSLNLGISHARGGFVAYLPADDIYFADHLQTLTDKQAEGDADMVYSGIVHNIGNRGGECGTQKAEGKIEGQTLQLVQVMHRRTADRWVERSEFVTDDLDRMFWNKFRENNPRTAATHKITCEWFCHTYQRHNIFNDRNGGGIYMYKTYYGVKEPLRYHSSVGNLVDEVAHYSGVRTPEPPKAETGKGLKILLVGELAFNPERILALEKRGHRLYGLWINNPLCYNTVGPLPFGHVEDVPFEHWEERIREIKPDVIYAMLNFKAVSLAHHVLTHRPKNIPFVWHFKEGPFFCRSYGLWSKLIDLFEQSEGIVYTNRRMQQWFDIFLRRRTGHTIVIDGDLPSDFWFGNDRKPLLSDQDGEIHTVLAGRLFGLGSEDIEALGNQHIHFHIYGEVNYQASQKVIDEAAALVPGYVHVHPNCPTESWVSEFSQYDAGWLHYYESANEGDLLRANWVDINSPARMSTYAMVGLPIDAFRTRFPRVYGHYNHTDAFRNPCYADLKNECVVNYDGNVYKCTARDFTPENSLGSLNSDGNITWNSPDFVENRVCKKFNKEICNKCRIFPICGGGCAQNALEYKGDTCPKYSSELEKDEIILMRFYNNVVRTTINKNQ